jgi:hypothetical protein
VEEQSYRSCIALLKLSLTYSNDRLEAACEKALSYSAHPSFRSIRTILKTGSDKLKSTPQTQDDDKSLSFAFTRGAKYYGGGKNAE